MLNLSKPFTLSPSQFSLLRRGLKFIPTRGTNKNLIDRTQFDLQPYHRKLKLAAHFEHKKESDPPPFTPKSEWSPPEGKLPPEVLKIIEADIRDFDRKFTIHRVQPNLNKENVEALDSLRKKHADYHQTGR